MQTAMVLKCHPVREEAGLLNAGFCCSSTGCPGTAAPANAHERRAPRCVFCAKSRAAGGGGGAGRTKYREMTVFSREREARVFLRPGFVGRTGASRG